MNLFSWNESLETGLSEVDQQHHHLIDMTNAYGALLAQDNVCQTTASKLVKALLEYTTYHFETEEKIMRDLMINHSHVAHHLSEHQTFLQEVLTIESDIATGCGRTQQNLFDFLINWLVYHILGTDMKMAYQLKSDSKASSATSDDQINNKSTNLLLTALNNLFQQVSTRNSQLTELNQTLENKVHERTQELLKSNQKLQELASTDALTGLHNRRYALRLLKQLWIESEQEQRPLACIMIDADQFKQVNDKYGHDAGDLVLKELAKQLTHAVRTDDLVCRLGGDEFLIICPGTDMTGALTVAQSTHAKIAELTVPVPGEGEWKGSISVGIGIKNRLMNQPEELIKAADKNVYAAKKAGKNCVRHLA